MSAQSESQSSFKFLPLGAIIQSFDVSGKNIVLNFPTEEDYAKRNEPHFGETIGRVANRLKYAVMHLNGRDYMLDKNDPPNCIHGGFKGWGQQTFHPARERRHGKDAWRFSYTSGNNDGKFPGTVEVTLWYTEYEKQDLRRKTVLEIEYEVSARDMECEETAVNVTNHSYFNLTGNKTISGTKVQLYARRYLPIDHTGIPIGAIKQFPVDVTKQFELKESDPKIDNCFVLKTTTDPSKVSLDTRQQDLQLLGSFHHPDSGIHLEVLSTEPAFQFYTGDHINVTGEPSYVARAGFCIEPGRFINAINQPEWRSMSLLRKGQVYGSRIVYESWKE